MGPRVALAATSDGQHSAVRGRGDTGNRKCELRGAGICIGPAARAGGKLTHRSFPGRPRS
jgi:hypothetical protein